MPCTIQGMTSPKLPIRARAARMHPDARRELILAAAIRVYARRGLGDTRHSDVAKEAGLAVSTAFHYFPTKTDLLSAVLDEIARFLLKDVVASHASAKDAAPVVIERILMTFCDTMDSHPDHVRVWLEWSVSVRGEAWAAFKTFYQHSVESMARLVRRGKQEGSVEPELRVRDAARVIVGLAHMIVQMKLSGSPRREIEHTVHSLVHGYLEAAPRALRP